MNPENPGAPEKPVGFDLRSKRAERTEDAAAWTPQDAAYDAHVRVRSAEVTQFLAVWWEKQADGTEKLLFSNSTTGRAEAAWLLQKTLAGFTSGEL